MHNNSTGPLKYALLMQHTGPYAREEITGRIISLKRQQQNNKACWSRATYGRLLKEKFKTQKSFVGEKGAVLDNYVWNGPLYLNM